MLEIPKQPTTVMHVRFSDQGYETWSCEECKARGAFKVPKVCPNCLRRVMANVVYVRRKAGDGRA